MIMDDNVEGDEEWLLDNQPDASEDECWLFADKVSYLVGMCGYTTRPARRQAFSELMTRRKKNE